MHYNIFCTESYHMMFSISMKPVQSLLLGINWSTFVLIIHLKSMPHMQSLVLATLRYWWLMSTIKTLWKGCVLRLRLSLTVSDQLSVLCTCMSINLFTVYTGYSIYCMESQLSKLQLAKSVVMWISLEKHL